MYGVSHRFCGLDIDAASTSNLAYMDEMNQWSIQQIARIAGTTSRTLRHYGDVGLLPATRIGENGYRYYDRDALVRLQRILLLRDLGLGLPQISDLLEKDVSPADALERHLAWLQQEQDRVARQIASVRSTIEALTEGGDIMAETMFDGFDHTKYEEEVQQRWGATAYADGDRWWRGMSDVEKSEWKRALADLTRDWVAAAGTGTPSDGATAFALARRHVEWLTGIAGTPRGDDLKAYVVGLGEMYVADDRFAANYGGVDAAAFVRDALRAYADANL